MLVDDMIRLCNELGLKKVKVRGDNVMFCCPFHGESNPSCGISIVKEVGGCFACSATFNLVQLVAHCKSCSYGEAMEYLSSFFNKDFRQVVKTGLMLYGEDLPKDAPLPYSSLAPFRSGNITHPYLLKRGFTVEDFVNFKLGWDSERKRITIPFFDKDCNLLGFSSRAVLNESDAGYESIYGNEGKYLIYNHFKAKDYFYPLDKFQESGSIILVEGLLDAIWMHKFGYSNTLSLISAQASKEQIRKLKMFNAKQIILCLDNDKAGEEGCARLYKSLKNDFSFKKAILSKKDVQECSKEDLSYMMNNLEDYPKRVFKMYE